MAGEVDVASAGHNLTIEFVGGVVRFVFPTYRAALAMAGRPVSISPNFGKVLSFGEISVEAQVGRRTFELFPNSSWVMRLISPTIRSLGADS
ncbi:MAG: hypothetical protein AB8B55_14560 [Mariniblastus sp.]